MDLHEKSKDQDLMFCATPECSVITFVKELECPACSFPGSLVRHPIDGRGAPGWVGRAEDVTDG